ncbi:hypothetical protein FQA39_LY02358 [Lamprigera yunnana]|nr:hypothetical protein FQA39_LY02358 [Lamprigera yunnana]
MGKCEGQRYKRRVLWCTEKLKERNKNNRELKSVMKSERREKLMEVIRTSDADSQVDPKRICESDFDSPVDPKKNIRHQPGQAATTEEVSLWKTLPTDPPEVREPFHSAII